MEIEVWSMELEVGKWGVFLALFPDEGSSRDDQQQRSSISRTLIPDPWSM